MIDKRPALIARCETADDVAAAIRFARDERRASPLPGGAGHQGEKGHTLLGASRKGKRGREPERTRQWRAGAHRVINLDHCAFHALSKVGQARS